MIQFPIANAGLLKGPTLGDVALTKYSTPFALSTSLRFLLHGAAMKPSRVMIRTGLILVNIGIALLGIAPRLALKLFSRGEQMSDEGFKLMCYGY